MEGIKLLSVGDGAGTLPTGAHEQHLPHVSAALSLSEPARVLRLNLCKMTESDGCAGLVTG